MAVTLSVGTYLVPEGLILGTALPFSYVLEGSKKLLVLASRRVAIEKAMEGMRHTALFKRKDMPSNSNRCRFSSSMRNVHGSSLFTTSSGKAYPP